MTRGQVSNFVSYTYMFLTVLAMILLSKGSYGQVDFINHIYNKYEGMQSFKVEYKYVVKNSKDSSASYAVHCQLTCFKDQSNDQNIGMLEFGKSKYLIFGDSIVFVNIRGKKVENKCQSFHRLVADRCPPIFSELFYPIETLSPRTLSMLDTSIYFNENRLVFEKYHYDNSFAPLHHLIKFELAPDSIIDEYYEEITFRGGEKISKEIQIYNFVTNVINKDSLLNVIDSISRNTNPEEAGFSALSNEVHVDSFYQILNIPLFNTAGDTVTLSSILSSSKVTVIDFWYIGCKPCLEMKREIDVVSKNYSDSMVEFITINPVNNFEQFREYALRNEYNPAYDYSCSKGIAEVLNLYGYPIVLIINNNRVEASFLGYGHDSGNNLRLNLDNIVTPFK